MSVIDHRVLSLEDDTLARRSQTHLRKIINQDKIGELEPGRRGREKGEKRKKEKLSMERRTGKKLLWEFLKLFVSGMYNVFILRRIFN